MAISKAQHTAHGAVSQPYQLLPPLSDDEFASLKADIAKHGILVAVELDEHGHLLDGHHRVRAWQELRSEGVRVPDFPRVIRAGLTEAEKRSHVRAVNLVRRHLSAAQRRAIIADALREDASQSDRQVASMLGVSHPTVAAVRRELEGRGDVERFTTRMDVLGRSQPVRHPTITVSSPWDERRALAALATLGNDAPGRFLTVRRAESLAREAQLERRRNARGRKVVQGRDWEIRHGDFRLALNDVADESVDLVLTDPPYGDDALPLWSDLAELSARVLKPGRVLVALTGQLRLGEVIGALTEHLTWVWLGMIPRTGAASPVMARGLRIDSRFIPVVVLSARRYEPRGYFLDVVKSDAKDEGLKAEHPWEQPVGPFLKLAEAFSKPNELVLDPLCGTGTTGVAALQLGRRFLGVDKDKAAVSLAIERLSRR
jgi:ParB-like chromosome segregation protein Spo0J